MLYLHVETTSIASIAIACQENEVVVLRQRLTEGESRDSPIEGEAESEKVDQAVPLGPPVDPRGFPQEKTCGTQPEVGIYFDLLKPFWNSVSMIFYVIFCPYWRIWTFMW